VSRIFNEFFISVFEKEVVVFGFSLLLVEKYEIQLILNVNQAN
jgi:hypothetical protein